jgi:uncharacterized protein YuzE
MDAVKILDNPESLSCTYDEEADVLYLSSGKPSAALGVDVGDGVVLRYDEARREVVGVTILAVRQRLMRGLGESPA